MAADKENLVLKYYMTIIAYTQQLLDMEDFFCNLSKLYSRHINFYCKKLTQDLIEVGYGLLNVA